MGREIRRVPPDWEHPRDGRGNYQPLFDEDYESAVLEWISDGQRFVAGEDVKYGPDDESYPRTWTGYAEWFGDGPSLEYHRPRWEAEPTHYQVYETVSEGTPCSPVLPTKEAVIEWLVEHGAGGIVGPMSREAAEKFVGHGSAPSLVIDGRGVRSGAEAMGDLG